MRRGVPLFTIFSVALLLSACGGGSSSGTGQLRFVQGSPDAPLVNFVVDGTTQASNLVYGNASAYTTLREGSRHVQIIPVNSTSALLDQTIPVTSDANYTLYLTGTSGQRKPLVLSDGGTTSVTGNGFVRVLNISTTMGPADVYIVSAGSGLSGATPTDTNLDFDQNTPYRQVPVGNYQVFVTVHGTLNAYLNTGPINLAQGKNQTIVVRDAPAGGFTYSELDDQ